MLQAINLPIKLYTQLLKYTVLSGAWRYYPFSAGESFK